MTTNCADQMINSNQIVNRIDADQMINSDPMVNRITLNISGLADKIIKPDIEHNCDPFHQLTHTITQKIYELADQNEISPIDVQAENFPFKKNRESFNFIWHRIQYLITELEKPYGNDQKGPGLFYDKCFGLSGTSQERASRRATLQNLAKIFKEYSTI